MRVDAVQAKALKVRERMAKAEGGKSGAGARGGCVGSGAVVQSRLLDLMPKIFADDTDTGRGGSQ
jgi:hypothetical protein